MKTLLLFFILIFSLNVTSQICNTYTELDSFYSNSDLILKIIKHDTIYNGEHIISYYYNAIGDEAMLVFIDSICYSYTAIYRGELGSFDGIINFLNVHYDKHGLYWFGKNDEKIDLCYYNKLNVYILTMTHNSILK